MTFIDYDEELYCGFCGVKRKAEKAPPNKRGAPTCWKCGKTLRRVKHS